MALASGLSAVQGEAPAYTRYGICSVACPQKVSFVKSARKEGLGNGDSSPINGAENPQTPGKPQTVGERSGHEQSRTHREDRRGGRRVQGRGPEALRGLRAGGDRGAQRGRGGPDHGLWEVLRPKAQGQGGQEPADW